MADGRYIDRSVKDRVRAFRYWDGKEPSVYQRGETRWVEEPRNIEF